MSSVPAKRRNINNRTRRQEKRSDTVTLHVKANKSFTGVASQVQLIMQLDEEATNYGIPAFSETAKAYFDMYRYFRIKRLSVSCYPFGSAPSIPKSACTLAHIAPGISVTPTTSLDFETPNQVMTTNDLANIKPLVLTNNDLKGIGQWAVTQSDATDDIITSFGAIYLAQITNGSTMYFSTTYVNVFIHMDIHLEFRMLLDPATISTRLANLPPQLNFSKEVDTPTAPNNGGYQYKSDCVLGCNCHRCRPS